MSQSGLDNNQRAFNRRSRFTPDPSNPASSHENHDLANQIRHISLHTQVPRPARGRRTYVAVEPSRSAATSNHASRRPARSSGILSNYPHRITGTSEATHGGIIVPGDNRAITLHVHTIQYDFTAPYIPPLTFHDLTPPTTLLVLQQRIRQDHRQSPWLIEQHLSIDGRALDTIEDVASDTTLAQLFGDGDLFRARLQIDLVVQRHPDRLLTTEQRAMAGRHLRNEHFITGLYTNTRRVETLTGSLLREPNIHCGNVSALDVEDWPRNSLNDPALTARRADFLSPNDPRSGPVIGVHDLRRHRRDNLGSSRRGRGPTRYRRAPRAEELPPDDLVSVEGMSSWASPDTINGEQPASPSSGTSNAFPRILAEEMRQNGTAAHISNRPVTRGSDEERYDPLRRRNAVTSETMAETREEALAQLVVAFGGARPEAPSRGTQWQGMAGAWRHRGSAGGRGRRVQWQRPLPYGSFQPQFRGGFGNRRQPRNSDSESDVSPRSRPNPRGGSGTSAEEDTSMSENTDAELSQAASNERANLNGGRQRSRAMLLASLQVAAETRAAQAERDAETRDQRLPQHPYLPPPYPAIATVVPATEAEHRDRHGTGRLQPRRRDQATSNEGPTARRDEEGYHIVSIWFGFVLGFMVGVYITARGFNLGRG